MVGGGFGGLTAAARLREAGLARIRVVDKAGDLGGTWYWNRYPGVACDIESYIYLPLLEEVGGMPSRKYAPGEEIRQHARAIGEHYDLYHDACFRTEVTALHWEEDRDYRLQPDTVTVVCVRSLYPGTVDQFNAAAGGIGDVLRAVYENCNGPIDLYLSGGLKATLLHTLAMAEVLRSRDRRDADDDGERDERPVRAWYLFEEKEGSAHASNRLTRSGLRYFSPEEFTDMDDELAAAAEGEAPPGERFKDTAWEETHDGAKLTAFGVGYHAVLGTRPVIAPDGRSCG